MVHISVYLSLPFFFLKGQVLSSAFSLAVEGLDPEIIGIEENLVSKKAQFLISKIHLKLLWGNIFIRV